METIKAVSPTESGDDKSGESYRKWNRYSEAVFMRSLKFIKRTRKGEEAYGSKELDL